jgi:hypothetical protein
MVASGSTGWLSAKRSKGLDLEYDPDEAFIALEQRVATDEPFPLADRSGLP